MDTIETLLKELIAELRLRAGKITTSREGKIKNKGVKPSTLAHDFGVHPRTIVRAIKDGRVSATPCGRSWSIPRQEAERVKREGIGSPQSRLYLKD